jgi:DNA polymerase-3 subunit delta'
MTSSFFLNPLNSTKLVLLDRYFNEMTELYNSKKLPKALLLSGKKGIGKFTLVLHFLNYIFTKNEKETYDIKNKKINTKSLFYSQLLNQTNQDIIFVKAEENKNIKIDDIRNLKSKLTRSSLSNNPRFIIIDEVEFINENSVNALLKSLEEPTNNNFYILINNQQADLLETISSRCLKTNIFLNSKEVRIVTSFLLENNNIKKLIDLNDNLTPGLFIQYNQIYSKLNIEKNDSIITKIYKLLNAHKKNKNKTLINLTLFLIDQYFLRLIQQNENKLDFLLKIKIDINNNINDFIYYNLNINSVLNSIEIKLKNV